jgi:drug/metabolite transporter (DMT)-like permease
MNSKKRLHYYYSKHKSTIIGYISAILSAAFFGSVSTIAKPVVSTIDPLFLSSLVYLVSGLVLTFLPKLNSRSLTSWLPSKSGSTSFRFAASLSIPNINRKDYLLIFIVAILGAAIAPALYFLGLQNTSASDAALLVNGEIIFSIIFALLIFKNERLKPIGYMSIILVIIGIIVVTTNLQFDKSSLSKVNYGDILIIGAAILWAVDNNISKVITQRVDIIKLIQLKSLIGGSMLIAFAILILNVPLLINLSQIPYIILLGIVGFAVSLYFFLYSLKILGTIRTIIIFSMSSVFGLIFAFIFLNEPISMYQIIAAVAMLAGIYTVNRKNGNSENKEKIHIT